MSSQFTFENAGNSTLDIDDGSIYTVVAVNGKGMPALDVRAENRFGRSGATLRAVTIPPRRLTLSILITGTSSSNLETRATALLAHLAGSYGRETQREGVLRFTNDTGNQRYLNCLAVAGLDENRMQRVATHSYLVPVTFFAAHGNWYDPSQQTSSGNIGPAGDLSFPYSYPIGFGLSQPSVSFSVTNSGSAETETLQWSVPGPSTAPQLHNVTVTRSVKFDSLIVPEGLTLVVRMGWQPDGIETFQAFLDDGAGGSTNVLGNLSSTSRRFWLDPGLNSMFASQTNEDETTHTINWYNEFIGV